MPLRLCQRDLRLLLPSLALMQFAPEPAPIPDGNRQVEGDEVAEIGQDAQLRLSGNRAVQREFIGLDAVDAFEREGRIELQIA